MKMLKELLVFLILFSLLSGCCFIPRPPKDYKFSNTALFRGEYKDIFNETAKTVKEMGFRIRQADENSKVLRSFDSIINPAYFYGFFSHNDDDGYCDCGAPSSEWVYSKKFVQLNIFFIPKEEPDLWYVKIIPKFYTFKYYDQIVPIIQPPLGQKKSVLECKSMGRLEEGILDSLRKVFKILGKEIN